MRETVKLRLMGATDLEAVWPKDGALLSPIFMITKKFKKDKIQPFIDFFMSEEIGTLFSANGKQRQIFDDDFLSS